MSDLKTKFDELIAEQKELARKFQVTAQSLFKETTKEFFEKNPAVKAVVWTQYTPYFNDGSTCEFGVNEPSFTNAEGEDLDEVSPYGEYDGGKENIWVVEEWSIDSVFDKTKEWMADTRKAIEASGAILNPQMCKEFSSILRSGDFESVMKAMFGDHVKVVATKDGFDVEEYDHD